MGTVLLRRFSAFSSAVSGGPAAGADEPDRITRAGLRRFDRLFDLLVGGFGILYSLQTADSFVADLPSLSDSLGAAVVALVAVSTLAGIGPLVVPSRAGLILVTGAGVYGSALLLWAWTTPPPVSTDPMPWLIAMWPVAAAYLAQGARGARGFRSHVAPVATAAAFSAAASLGLGVHGHVAVSDLAVDTLFMTGIALVLILLLGTVRQRVEAAARTEQLLVDGYASAQLEDATDRERTRTDALLHDGVLMTFLSAASAHDADAENLSSRMAANSLRILLHVNAVGRSEDVRPFGQVLAESEERLGALLRHFEHDFAAVEVVMLPDEVARAVVDVLERSLENSARHAEGATKRTVRAHPLGSDGIRIIIEDDGCGFDPDILGAAGALGNEAFRALRSLEGRVDVESSPGAGARVVLSWGSVSIVGTELLRDESQEVRP